MKLIITGTGRSGTAYMYKLFNLLGVPCGHEEVYSAYGKRSWSDGYSEAKWRSNERMNEGHTFPGDEFMADSSFAAMPWIPFMDDDETIIYHIVRDPATAWVSQMSSHVGTPTGQALQAQGQHGGFWSRLPDDAEVGPYVSFMETFGEYGPKGEPLSRSISYMRYWTEKIHFFSQRFDHKFLNQLENLSLSDIIQILQMMQISQPKDLEKVIASVDTRSNWRPSFYTAEDLILDHPDFLAVQQFYNEAA